MATPAPTIFRPEALEYRLRTRERRHTGLTFPWLMARPVGIALWLLLGMLVVAAGAACFASVPVSEPGLALVATDPDAGSSSPLVAVLMPVEFEHRLQPGQAAEVLLGFGDAETPGTIVAIEQDALDPAGVQQRLGLAGPVLSMLDGPVVVVWVGLDDSTDVDAGTVGQADLAVGSQRAGAFLPLVGGLFGE